jgi:hypothetical protein
MSVIGRKGANEFDACDKDASTTAPKIICYKATFSGVTATLSNPTNPTITNNGATVGQTDTGTQQSYDVGFESVSGVTALAVFSDNTYIPKFKKFTASSGTWDANWTSIAITGTPQVFKTIRIIPQDQGDDMLVLMADANLDLYSIFWDGTNNQMYSTPLDKAYKGHGTSGVATANFWYDFAWDKF